MRNFGKGGVEMKTKVTAAHVANVFRELESDQVVVNEELTMRRDAEGLMYVGHTVMYRGEEYFVLAAPGDEIGETAFHILKLDKRSGKRSDYTPLKKIHYDVSDIYDLVGTQEDFVVFVKFNFIDWLAAKEE